MDRPQDGHRTEPCPVKVAKGIGYFYFFNWLGRRKVESTGISIVKLNDGPALEILRENEFGFSYAANKFRVG